METLALQESPHETERLLASAAFGGTIDMAAFTEAAGLPVYEKPGFTSTILPDDTKASFTSLL